MATPGHPRSSDDFTLPEPERLPLVKAGPYVGVTTDIARRNFKGRRAFLALIFDLFPTAESLGLGEVPLARGVEHYLNYESAGPRSRYARLLAMTFPERGQGEKVKASGLIGKSYEVEVSTVTTDSDQKKLSEAEHYSKVSRVLRLA